MIPIIDFKSCSLSLPDSQLTVANKTKLGEEICQAFRSVGFVYLVNHGISNEKVNELNEVAKKFFQLDQEVKKRCARSASDANFGYVGMEVEQLSSLRPGDLKEAFNMTPKQESKQKWPTEEFPAFEPAMWDMYDNCTRLASRVLHLMGLGLNIQDPELFVKAHRTMKENSATTLRTLYYPPLPSHFEIKDKQIRCGEHSDYGSITLLFQDQVGGLEVMNCEGEYVSAIPIPGSVLVNVGDLMQRWTSDVLKSTKHRVLIPEEEVKKQEVRQSLAFFVHPDDDEVINCIDGSGKYEPVTALDYLNMRFAATY